MTQRIEVVASALCAFAALVAGGGCCSCDGSPRLLQGVGLPGEGE